ncbi:hypothetical protein MHYP_G00160920 [Metynnis hypsauchen]
MGAGCVNPELMVKWLTARRIRVEYEFYRLVDEVEVLVDVWGQSDVLCCVDDESHPVIKLTCTQSEHQNTFTDNMSHSLSLQSSDVITAVNQACDKQTASPSHQSAGSSPAAQHEDGSSLSL